MLPALIVGAYTAWHLGLTTGGIAAAVVAVALAVAAFLPIPGLTLAIWVVVLGWCALLYFAGPAIGAKVSKRGGGGLSGTLGGTAGVYRKAAGAWSYLRRRMR